MVSQFITNDQTQRKKRFLGEMHDFPEDAMAVGRLDETSEGLLLITTDGQWSHHVNTSPDFQKEYYAQVDGILTEDALDQLRKGVTISTESKKYHTQPAVVSIIPTPDLPPTKQRIRDDRHGPTSWVSITISEGKFRQVRKMCSVVGFPVLRLARIRIGEFTLKSLNNEKVVEVTETVNHLIEETNKIK
jgi:23S rRNA pseudouridine2457 synthase